MITIRLLAPDDDRPGFASGDPDLDRFFRRYSGQNQFRHHIGSTYVALEDDALVGFVTVNAASITIQDLPASRTRRLPRYPLPVLRLARLAVDERARGRGIGLTLLRWVMDLALEMSTSVGCVGVVVDAKPPAVPFYESLGFRTLEVVRGRLGERPQPVALFLPLGSIAGL
jgi:GNAT superfamily N-acetyltransferase